MPEFSLFAALLAGLLGGAHCVGMCGGIVTAMSLQHGRAHPFALHLGYNFGRIASYALAGGLVGWLGAMALLADHLLPVQKGLYVLAQLMLILLGLYLAGVDRTVLALERAGGVLWQRLQPRFGRLLPVRSFAGAVSAGALWGWLPCGLVYSVLVMALASGGPAEGGALMLAFGLGTLPNLLGMAWMADRLRTLTRKPWVKHLAGFGVAASGLWGLARLVFQ